MNNSVHAVNFFGDSTTSDNDNLLRLVESASSRDLERLRRTASFHTNSSDLSAALRKVANDRATNDWISRPEELEKRWLKKAQAMRLQALDDLDEIARLPDLYIEALLTICDMKGQKLEELRADLEGPIVYCANRPTFVEFYVEKKITVLRDKFEKDIKAPPGVLTSDGEMYVRGDEDEMRARAEVRAANALLHAEVKGIELDAIDEAEQSCPRWQLRRLRREVKAAQSYYDIAFRLANPTCKYVSEYTLTAWRLRQARQSAWLNDQVIDFDGTTVSLLDIRNNALNARQARLYAQVKGMESVAERLGYTAFFGTITLPGEYHPFSSHHGRANQRWRREFGPAAQHLAIQGLWKNARARIWKHDQLTNAFGIRVVEPHQDGTPHLHFILWLPSETGGRSTKEVLAEILEDLAPAPQSELAIIEKNTHEITMRDGRRMKASSPASYVMKYLLKSVGTSYEAPDVETDEDHLIGENNERFRAWANARQVRSFSFIGVHGVQTAWQKLFTWNEEGEAPALPPRHSEAKHLIESAQSAPKAYKATLYGDALIAMGAFRTMGDGTRLSLRSEETVTEYGRSRMKPVGIIDTRTNDEVPLHLQEYKPESRSALAIRKKEEEDLTTQKVTLRAIYPREAASLPPVDPTCPAWLAAHSIATVILSRQGLPQWTEWVERKRHRVMELVEDARLEAA
ncbi:MAG: replication endonuclease [Alphaproteobacteria bacterium]|nr:replication endonuclease [Alphaproteobacteria bacterium]